MTDSADISGYGFAVRTKQTGKNERAAHGAAEEIQKL